MILNFSAVNLNHNPEGIAFNTENKKFTHNKEIWEKEETIPLSLSYLCQITRTVIRSGYDYTDDIDIFYMI